MPAIHTFEGLAHDVTTRSQLDRFGRSYRLVRVGDELVNVTHEYEPGWRPAYMFKVGERYRVSVFREEAPPPVPTDKSKRSYSGWHSPEPVPNCRTAAPGFEFWKEALDITSQVQSRRTKEARQTVRSHGVWTDGLSLHSVDTVNGVASLKLTPGVNYRVLIEELALEPA